MNNEEYESESHSDGSEENELDSDEEVSDPGSFWFSTYEITILYRIKFWTAISRYSPSDTVIGNQ